MKEKAKRGGAGVVANMAKNSKGKRIVPHQIFHALNTQSVE
jgi:hypothetical protein